MASIIGVVTAIYFPGIRILLYIITLAMLMFDFKKMHQLIRKRILQEPSNMHPENNVVLAYANSDPIHIAVDITRETIPHNEACYSHPSQPCAYSKNCNTTDQLIRKAKKLASMDNGEANVSMLKLTMPISIKPRIVGGSEVVLKYVQQRNVAYTTEIHEPPNKNPPGLMASTPAPSLNNRIHMNLSQFPGQGLQYEYTTSGKVVTKLVEMQNLEDTLSPSDEYKVHIVHSKVSMQPVFALTDTEGNVHLLNPSIGGCIQTVNSLPAQSALIFKQHKLSQGEYPLPMTSNVMQTLCETHIIHEQDQNHFKYLKSLTNVRLRKREKIVFYYDKNKSLKATQSKGCVCSEHVIQERALTVATTVKTALIGGAGLFVGCALVSEVLV